MATSGDTTSSPGAGPGIVRFTGAVHAALDRLDAHGPAPAWAMTPAEQRRALVDLAALAGRVAELFTRVLAAADRNDVGKDTGHPTTTAWLAQATGMTRPAARAAVGLAHALDGPHQQTRTALAAGAVNLEQARAVIAAVDALSDQVPLAERRRGEAHLLAEATGHDAGDLKVLGARLREVLDPEHAEQIEARRLAAEEAAAARRVFLRLRANGDGTHTGRFKVPDLHAAILRKALEAICAPRRTHQPGGTGPDTGPGPETGAGAGTGAGGAGGRTAVPFPERLGAAFCHLLERYPLDPLPTAGGVSATVVVTMSLDHLLGGLGVATLDDGTPITAAQARRLACQAGLVPMVLGGDSVPLDLGRRRRTHTGYQRIALAHRDGGCTAEGCDRPPAWCEAHHDTPWAHGGATDLTHGRLLCPHHHRRVHDPAYQTTRLPDGTLRFHRRT